MKSLSVKFWEKVDKSPGHGPDGLCWIWTASTNEKGYGRLMIDGYPKKAHRLGFVLQVGSIPDGLHVLHKCDNPACVRGDHLFLGTNYDNVLDRMAKSRNGGGVRKIGPEGTSWCSACRQFLPVRAFHKQLRRWNGLSFTCKKCRRETERVKRRNLGVKWVRISRQQKEEECT